MALRVTRQTLEALVQPSDSTLRVSRQYAEVLVPLPTSEPTEFNESVSNTLVLGQTVSASLNEPTIFDVSVGNALQLSQDPYYVGPKSVEAESILHLTSSAHVLQTFELSVGNTLALGQSVERFGTQWLDASNTIRLQQYTGTRVWDLEASNQIELSQTLSREVTATVTSQLTLSQTLVHQALTFFQNTLTLSQAATVSVDRDLRPTSTLAIRQALSYTLEVGGTLQQYNPFVGESTDPDAPAPPPLTLNEPMNGILARFQLVYPATGDVTDSVSLRAPNLGNRDRLAFDRIQRETRGGHLIVYADPQWPKVQTLVLSFSGLYRVEARALLTFLLAHLGQEIGLIDWEHRYWKGVIVTPTDPIVEDAGDSYTASFEFEGELDPTWTPQVVPLTPRTRSTDESRVWQYRDIVSAEEPEEMDGVVVFYEAEAVEAVSIGSPVYVTEQATIRLAQAMSAARCHIVGFSTTETGVGAACKYISEGEVHRDDWTAIAGTVNLTPGAAYFLDTALGKITRIAPSSPGQYVVRVGRAVSPIILDVEIEDPILL